MQIEKLVVESFSDKLLRERVYSVFAEGSSKIR